MDQIAKHQERTIMRLCRKYSDASKHKPELKTFSDKVALLLDSAKRIARQWAQVARTFMHQVAVPCVYGCALTSGYSGSTNAPLRYAFAAH